MFLTEEEALKRLSNRRNIFSSDWDSSEEDSSSEDREEDKDKEPAPKASQPKNEIDNLLDAVDDPYALRQGKSNLRGQMNAQVAIGTVSNLIGPTATGPIFGLSANQTGAYQVGLGSTSEYGNGIKNSPIPDRTRRIKSAKEQIAELASKKLKSALTSLTDDKIDECKAQTISGIAKDMAIVMDKVTKDNQKSEAIHFHIFRPEMKSVKEYTTVNVSAPLIIPYENS